MGEDVVKRALLIAYHFPPVRGSSGVLRTLKNAQHLPRYGWTPAVLTIAARAYPERTETDDHMLPESVEVHRAFGLDAARQLAVAGRYPGFLARPDRWATWWLGAVLAGLRVVRRLRPQVIWSTYPIATAHRIGYTLHRLTGIPWVADFRDSMTEPDYPRDARLRKVYREIERRTIDAAARVVFTAPGTLAMYRERYPRIAAERLHCIENGYDEEDFVAAGTRAVQREGGADCFELLHSGVLYPIERDPRPLFEALARLKRAGAISAATLRLTLRATAHDAEFRPLLAQFGIADHVRLVPALDYHDALAEMMQADGLLLLQAANCNHQIPAKLYEYLRAGRPILALTDAAGDTAAQVRSAAAGMICPLDDAAAIAQSLTRFISDVRQGTAPRATLAAAQAFSRSAQAGRLAALFDSISPETAAPR